VSRFCDFEPAGGECVDDFAPAQRSVAELVGHELLLQKRRGSFLRRLSRRERCGRSSGVCPMRWPHPEENRRSRLGSQSRSASALGERCRIRDLHGGSDARLSRAANESLYTTKDRAATNRCWLWAEMDVCCRQFARELPGRWLVTVPRASRHLKRDELLLIGATPPATEEVVALLWTRNARRPAGFIGFRQRRDGERCTRRFWKCRSRMESLRNRSGCGSECA